MDTTEIPSFKFVRLSVLILLLAWPGFSGETAASAWQPTFTPCLLPIIPSIACSAPAHWNTFAIREPRSRSFSGFCGKDRHPLSASAEI